MNEETNFDPLCAQLGALEADVYFYMHEVFCPAGRWELKADPFFRNGVPLEGCSTRREACAFALWLLERRLGESHEQALKLYLELRSNLADWDEFRNKISKATGITIS